MRITTEGRAIPEIQFGTVLPILKGDLKPSTEFETGQTILDEKGRPVFRLQVSLVVPNKDGVLKAEQNVKVEVANVPEEGILPGQMYRFDGPVTISPYYSKQKNSIVYNFRAESVAVVEKPSRPTISGKQDN